MGMLEPHVSITRLVKKTERPLKGVVLGPHVLIKKGTDLAIAKAIHHKIHQIFFIARSVNFPVKYEPSFGRDS